ncbi:RNA 2',3'-cyclic phosphodiesterase [Virgibacillus soli]|uniref:RNA 2',3'-cyclic phosphodiesterase n=1 Tax=Paracerasibacillus soli TaxID=480284 RepID=A0ABU5CQT5_9BACI|nr:RNA 2',3'-cyclic phosphodiesterase [Virgibacillus soli]MDY0408735.1 RNA 2',3'-cyclic phosphodiesterase [Virgibacillus soli]
MDKVPHYFIAIPLPTTLKEHYAVWQKQLRQYLSYKQWPHPKDLHITLKFLGGVKEPLLLQLCEALKQIEGLFKFEVETGEIGTFGQSDSPRVLWAGVKLNSQLHQLYEEVERIALGLHFPKENRTYRPHITLAKKWNGPAQLKTLIDIKEKFSQNVQTLFVNEIVLYKIEPQQSPKYKVIHTYQLSGEMNGTIN